MGLELSRADGATALLRTGAYGPRCRRRTTPFWPSRTKKRAPALLYLDAPAPQRLLQLLLHCLGARDDRVQLGDFDGRQALPPRRNGPLPGTDGEQLPNFVERKCRALREPDHGQPCQHVRVVVPPATGPSGGGQEPRGLVVPDGGGANTCAQGDFSDLHADLRVP